MALHHCLNILWWRHWVTLTNLFFAESIMNWLSDEWPIRNWSSMGISAVIYQKKCCSKTICALQTYSSSSHFEAGHLNEWSYFSVLRKLAAPTNFKGRNRFLLFGGNNQRKSSSYNTVSECKSKCSGTSVALPEFTIPLNLSISQCLYLPNIKTYGKYRC